MTITITESAAKHVASQLQRRGKGVGLRLGANVGYLKFTPNPTWNPF